MGGERILVTGGAGYVGSHAVVRLLEEGYRVVVVDNLLNSYREGGKLPESLVRAQCLSGRKLDFHEVDLKDEQGLRKIFDKYHPVDCVVHFAALKSVSESCRLPLEYYSNNITGTLILLKVMLERGTRKLVYSSSATVYGEPESLPIGESHPTGRGCTNPYGKSKYMVEEILRDATEATKDLSVVSLRYFNPVGAHRSGRMGEDPTGVPNNLMPYVAQVAVGKLPYVNVYGNDYDTPDGTGVRDYIHIEDLVEGHLRALERMFSDPVAMQGFRAYNLGTGKGHSVLEVIEAFSRAAKKEISYRVVGRRPGDVATSFCDPSAAKRDLGWVTKRDLADMCEDMWRWQTMNPNGYAGREMNNKM